MSFWSRKPSYNQNRLDQLLALSEGELGQKLDLAVQELLFAKDPPWSCWEQLYRRGHGRAAVLWLQASPPHEAEKAGWLLHQLRQRWPQCFPAQHRPPVPQPAAATPLGKALPATRLNPQRLMPEGHRVVLDSLGFVGHHLLARCQEEHYEEAPQGGSYVSYEYSLQCWDCRGGQHRWSWPHDGLIAAGTSQGSYWAHTLQQGLALLNQNGLQEHLPFPIWLDFLHPSPDGQSLIGGNLRQVYRFDTVARRLARRAPLHQGLVNAHLMMPYFNADEDEMLMSFEEAQMPVSQFRLRDLKQTALRGSWRELPGYQHNQPAKLRQTLSPDGNWLARPDQGSIELMSCGASTFQ